MPEMQQEVRHVSFHKGMGGEKVQMPQVRQPEEPTGLREFLFQDFQKELDFYSCR